jgi:hypothetical protein
VTELVKQEDRSGTGACLLDDDPGSGVTGAVEVRSTFSIDAILVQETIVEVQFSG